MSRIYITDWERKLTQSTLFVMWLWRWRLLNRKTIQNKRLLPALFIISSKLMVTRLCSYGIARAIHSSLSNTIILNRGNKLLVSYSVWCTMRYRVRCPSTVHRRHGCLPDGRCCARVVSGYSHAQTATYSTVSHDAGIHAHMVEAHFKSKS